MRSKSPELMERIQKYAEDFIFDEGRSPSTTEIGNALGIARATAYKYLVAMDERGLLDYNGKEIETEQTRKIQSRMVRADILGAVPCGLPQCIEANVEERVSLPEAIFGTGDLFVLRASGDSMIEAGIDDGDLVVVRKQNTASEGDIVVALVDNENTLKRFYRDKRRGYVRLHPENRTMPDILVRECFIQGVAQHVIKAL